jgi:hypothetical protein
MNAVEISSLRTESIIGFKALSLIPYGLNAKLLYLSINSKN